ncbi:hypothetical protein [Micromonospora sp. RTP1Z1]|uniref:hypothetical protein n=1 Tax=Micromonospora sp. RTP1Z1 TaxID=2994043 RepID=UPI0029C6D99C|nr:hypothetical protein [Micromonospora sp. RTP1Z1]
MRFLGYSGWQLLAQLPTLLVLATGLVLALVNRRLPRGPRGLLFAGTAVLLLGALLNLAWVLALPHLVAGGWSAVQASRLTLVIGPLGALLHPAGLGLLVAAVLAGRRATAAPATPWSGWQPGAGDPAPQQWGGPDVPAPASAGTDRD